MVECLEVIEGCDRCQAEADYRGPHQCHSDSKMYVTMCEVAGRMKRKSESFHQLTHEPSVCDKCKTKLFDKLGFDATVTKWCREGYCRLICCPECGWQWASDGPVGCPACSPFPRTLRVRRMRTQYRRRRR